MDRSKSIITIVVVVAVLAVGAAVIGMTNKKDDTASSNTGTSSDMQMDNQSGMDDSASMQDATATDMVSIKDYMFGPATIKVKVGTEVTWTNNDSVRHNVVSDDGSANGPNGPLLAKGETYKYTFAKAGTYSYHCDPHPYMKAKVIVTE